MINALGFWIFLRGDKMETIKTAEKEIVRILAKAPWTEQWQEWSQSNIVL